MHDLHAARKLGVYRALYRVNRSFTAILGECEALRDLGVLKPQTARLYRAFARELQAEINCGLAGLIEAVESRDRSRYARARKAWEQDIRPSGASAPTQTRGRELSTHRMASRRPAKERSQMKRAALRGGKQAR